MEVLLRHRFVTGLKLQYRGTTRVHQEVQHSGVTTGEQDNEWESAMVQQVLAVDGDGACDVLTHAVPWVDNPGAAAAALAEQRQVTYVLMDVQGRVRQASTPNPPSTYSFPDRPLSIGQGWEAVTQFPLPPAGQIAHVPFYYTLKAIETYRGHSCAVIEVSAPATEWEVALPESGDPAMVTLETKGTIHFDHTRGFMVRTEMETSTVPRLGTQSVATVTSTVQELLAAG